MKQSLFAEIIALMGRRFGWEWPLEHNVEEVRIFSLAKERSVKAAYGRLRTRARRLKARMTDEEIVELVRAGRR